MLAGDLVAVHFISIQSGNLSHEALLQQARVTKVGYGGEEVPAQAEGGREAAAF